MKERTCIVCRKKGDRSSFFRIGRDKDGGLFIGSGGRGAYICRSESCLSQALKKPRIGYYLKTKQDAELECRLISALLERLGADDAPAGRPKMPE
ncbi:MAG: YlxR family protein [Abditibacteriota bacterium]|nr:YlxR family protein [Abditibacteriota bacterium]